MTRNRTVRADTITGAVDSCVVLSLHLFVSRGRGVLGLVRASGSLLELGSGGVHYGDIDVEGVCNLGVPDICADIARWLSWESDLTYFEL